MELYNLKYRISDLSYIKVVYCLDGQMMDTRIKQSAVNTQFCLKLPQSLYDSDTGVVEPIFTPMKMKSTTFSLME